MKKPNHSLFQTGSEGRHDDWGGHVRPVLPVTGGSPQRLGRLRRQVDILIPIPILILILILILIATLILILYLPGLRQEFAQGCVP